MNVSDIMTEKPVSISQDRSLREALETMARVGCHHLPVISAEGHLVGIITVRDCHVALNLPPTRHEDWHSHRMVDHLQVRTSMTPAPIVVEPDTSADEAARLMLRHHISSLPVMRGETLIGIVTTSDILAAFMKMHQLEAQASKR